MMICCNTVLPVDLTVAKKGYRIIGPLIYKPLPSNLRALSLNSLKRAGNFVFTICNQELDVRLLITLSCMSVSEQH